VKLLKRTKTTLSNGLLFSSNLNIHYIQITARSDKFEENPFKTHYFSGTPGKNDRRIRILAAFQVSNWIINGKKQPRFKGHWQAFNEVQICRI
jgi:hypothetical protein